MAGRIALILHAHLPFVRHPEHKRFLEESWLFEAITETYIPLLRMLQRLVADPDSSGFKLTMSLTPTLCAMLQDELLRERYIEHVDLLIDLAQREQKRNRNNQELRDLAGFYFELFTDSRRFFVDEWQCNLIAAFRDLQKNGALEIIGCAATHGLLPLLQQSPEAVRAQVLIGRDQYVDLFGVEPFGFWLPECAYAPDLDSVLQGANIRWFVLDSHGLMFGNPRPQKSIFAPCYTPAGPAAFARDRESSRQVWSAKGGYPGDPAYREFYRDVGFDLPMEHLGPFGRDDRTFSGIKYHRITGRGEEKELYDPAVAEHVAEIQADHFFEQRKRQIREISALGFDPIVTIPFDAELFGHWWFEGPRFLEFFIRKVAADQNDFRLTTPSEYLTEHPTQQTIRPATSTWGENGHLEVWLNPSNAWIYPHLHAAAQKMTEIARRHSTDPAIVGQPLRLPSAELAGGAPALQSKAAVPQLVDRVLKQLARELLLAQSSDWAFLMKTGTAREYATKRTKDHLDRFNRLHDQFVANDVDEEFLKDCECRDNLFPNVNWRYYV